MNSITKNTVFWAVFWIVVAAAGMAAVIYIPAQIEQADEEVRRAETERAMAARELRQLEQRQMQEATPDPETSDEHRIADLHTLAAALETYYEAGDSYYPVATGEDGGLVLVESRTTPCKELIFAEHLTSCPRDPAWPERHYRYRSADGLSYELTALLDGENPADCTYVGDLCIYIVRGAAPGLSTEPEADSEEPEAEDEVSASLYDAISAAYTRY